MIVFDIDGTLSVVGDRLKYLQQNPKDWDSFYEACNEDLPNYHIVELCKTLSKEYTIYYVTGRRESVRDKTRNWLRDFHIDCEDSNLLMRKNGDTRHDIEVKPELVKDIIEDIDIVFEDRNSMVKKWRELGITCCQVAEGDF